MFSSRRRNNSIYNHHWFSRVYQAPSKPLNDDVKIACYLKLPPSLPCIQMSMWCGMLMFNDSYHPTTATTGKLVAIQFMIINVSCGHSYSEITNNLFRSKLSTNFLCLYIFTPLFFLSIAMRGRWMVIPKIIIIINPTLETRRDPNLRTIEGVGAMCLEKFWIFYPSVQNQTLNYFGTTFRFLGSGNSLSIWNGHCTTIMGTSDQYWEI